MEHKPCPFCGTNHSLQYVEKINMGHGDSTFDAGIFCVNCEATCLLTGGWGSPDGRTEKDVWEIWDSRPA